MNCKLLQLHAVHSAGFRLWDRVFPYYTWNKPESGWAALSHSFVFCERIKRFLWLADSGIVTSSARLSQSEVLCSFTEYKVASEWLSAGPAVWWQECASQLEPGTVTQLLVKVIVHLAQLGPKKLYKVTWRSVLNASLQKKKKINTWLHYKQL